MRTYIWSLPTRFIHWLIFIALVISYSLGGEEDFMNFHVALGYLAGSLILFRVIWGFIGPRYSRFSDFPVGISKLKEFVSDMKKSKMKYPGHNPAASLIMLAIMISIILVVLSGMLYLAAEGHGFLASLNLKGDSELFEEFHEAMVSILIALVAFHIAGIIIDTIFHRENGTLVSIFTGYKIVKGDNVKLNAFQQAFSIIWIIGALTFFAWTLSSQDIKINASGLMENHKVLDISGEEDDD